MILQTLYQNCIKHGVEFFDEFHVVDLLLEGGQAKGVVAYRIADGELHVFRSNAVMFATGGFGRMYKITSNALALTGDGLALSLPPRIAAGGHGVLPVPPDRHLRHWHPAVRGGARRGRHPAQQRGRALHGALCADPEGPGPA